jgi:hypothetical protein
MSIRRELIDELLKEYPKPQDVLAEDGLLKQLRPDRAGGAAGPARHDARRSW